MSHPLIQWLEATQANKTLPRIAVGDQVKVNYRIKEGEKERIQPFQGVVIRKHHAPGALTSTFTVRKVSQGFGVERIFPTNSPRIESIEVMRKGRVRRAKLYYLRGLKGKKARIRDKDFRGVQSAIETSDETSA